MGGGDYDEDHQPYLEDIDYNDAEEQQRLRDEFGDDSQANSGDEQEEQAEREAMSMTMQEMKKQVLGKEIKQLKRRQDELMAKIGRKRSEGVLIAGETLLESLITMFMQKAVIIKSYLITKYIHIVRQLLRR